MTDDLPGGPASETERTMMAQKLDRAGRNGAMSIEKKKEHNMDFTKIAEINLIGGPGGGDPKAGLCIMEMVSWFDGAQMVTDRPECACPFLTSIAINVNDRAPTQEDRNTLKPLLPMLAGTRDEPSRKARAWFVMRESVLRILCVRLEKIGKTELVATLRAAETPDALNVAVKAARAHLKASASASASASAAAFAFAAADASASASAPAAAFADAFAFADAAAPDAAAFAAADAYAFAAADAYAYAYAYAYAAAAVAVAQKRADLILADRKWTFGVMREILIEAIKLGPHGSLDIDTYDMRAAELRDVLGLEPVT